MCTPLLRRILLTSRFIMKKQELSTIPTRTGIIPANWAKCFCLAFFIFPALLFGQPSEPRSDTDSIHLSVGMVLFNSNVSPDCTDNDPLNGVSTFDLVLINKHILGLELFNSPYIIIAADANKSKAVTTFDIVEFRKLILGIYSELPNNTSWRFVDADYSFPDPANPFEEIFPEIKTVSTPFPAKADFVAIKVGDVNGNASADAAPNPVVSLALSTTNAVQAGQVVTIPVTYTGAESLEAFQLGLRFDPEKLSLIGPSQGDLPNYNTGNFGLTKAAQGEIRSLWFANPTVPDEALHPGDILFYLSFRAKKSLPAFAALLDADDTLLPNIAWKPDGKSYSLRPNEASKTRDAGAADTASPLTAACYPNPASGEIHLNVRSDRDGRARLAVFGPFGRLEWKREVTLEAGEQTFDIPEIAQLPAGVYFWKVLTPWAKTQGHLIRQ